MSVETGSQGCGDDSCLWKSYRCEIHDGRPKSVLCTMETISNAKYIANLLRDTFNRQDNPYSRKNYVSAWTPGVFNSFSRSFDACKDHGIQDVTEAICVSHTSKENTVLRSGLPPEKVFVVPNAVDTAMFKPASNRLSTNEIIIVVISRLVYRKGADLLVEVIPEVCRMFANVRFIIGGDGPKRVRLEEMREKHGLQDRVEMLGAVPHARVRSVLISGHIFLNSSLTEAFCIAILEAASCGLLTVSTRVGGVPEVLPDDMVVLAEPDPGDMVQAIKKAIFLLPLIHPQEMHDRMKKLYDWHDVARRTVIVYDYALRSTDQNLLERLSRYLSCGSWAGKLFCVVMIIDFLIWYLLKLWQPDENIEVVPDITLTCNQDQGPMEDMDKKKA
ncbi:phosphatidylinositol N-acetylglucosaminyltransferase subunit A isoform X2 [Momordica charantia]|uniref:Phosphatidylinositol N-acetylglucosaminyltransferase subunit A isoform X2 n=1 Tax=Momordica charantia TaxID=3673 RepID=A0A6J1DIQ3_MOMCH|nr:phosphatidylinositol N-acetylglucosaminyltransferase subunit A isoform X2 [Momordica charantia]